MLVLPDAGDDNATTPTLSMLSAESVEVQICIEPVLHVDLILSAALSETSGFIQPTTRTALPSPPFLANKPGPSK